MQRESLVQGSDEGYGHGLYSDIRVRERVTSGRVPHQDDCPGMRCPQPCVMVRGWSRGTSASFSKGDKPYECLTRDGIRCSTSLITRSRSAVETPGFDVTQLTRSKQKLLKHSC